jgi:hypothetical protein
MRPLFGPSKVTNGSQPLVQKEKASHKSIEPEVLSRSLPAGPDPTQRAQPKTPARPLWASFSEASKSSQSPFAALAQKEPKVIKPAASVEYKAPPAAMAPDLVTGASGPRTNWLTSGGKSNEGRLSPWEEVRSRYLLTRILLTMDRIKMRRRHQSRGPARPRRPLLWHTNFSGLWTKATPNTQMAGRLLTQEIPLLVVCPSCKAPTWEAGLTRRNRQQHPSAPSLIRPCREIRLTAALG